MKTNDSDALKYMRRAVDEAGACPENQARIGAVLVTQSGDSVQAHKSEDGSTKHAEQRLLEKALSQGLDVTGSTVFVTMEPCANIESKRTCCADLLIKAGVGTVYIGRYDMNFRINRQGWKRLVGAGVKCFDFTQELRDEIDQLNKVFQEHFTGRTGLLTGVARFDWTTNGGRYDLSLSDQPGSATWTTQWGTRGANSVYANGGHPGVVALARFATDFKQIDDPGAYDFGSHFAELEVGNIGIYRNEHGYALVKVLEVEAPPPYGNMDYVSLKFSFELRPNISQGKEAE